MVWNDACEHGSESFLLSTSIVSSSGEQNKIDVHHRMEVGVHEVCMRYGNEDWEYISGRSFAWFMKNLNKNRGVIRK